MEWTGMGLVWIVVGIYFLLRPDPIYSLGVTACCFHQLITYCRRSDLELWKRILVFSAASLFVILPVMWLEALLAEDQGPEPEQEAGATVDSHPGMGAWDVGRVSDPFLPTEPTGEPADRG
jgi:hypothetical protein